ncbi:MAG: 1-deoxy-D-xylulose-5-phosphate reductoisomerase, partial [Planctomycetota bacterium]
MSSAEPHRTRNVAILGSTGSVGRSALEVLREIDGFNVVGLSGHSNLELLSEQAREFQPSCVVATGPDSDSGFRLDGVGGCELLSGADALVRLATREDVDMVIAAIVGVAGLESTWAAVEAGKTVALANKETLVVAGSLVMPMAARTGATILPVDSEHSAVFQAIQAGRRNEIQRVVLTASGGPFRDFDHEQMKSVTVEQALNHPTWNMGQKISVDSATMMNKGLEVIEARWLFDLSPDRIAVMIHPQSIIHSLVEFVDSSVISQMSPPDMKLPIQYALTWPDRVPGPSPVVDWTKTLNLELRPPDFEQFPALELGFEVAKSGGTSGAVLNAANEAAVAAFLNKEISYMDIATSCREILNNHNYEPEPSLESLMEADRRARL